MHYKCQLQDVPALAEGPDDLESRSLTWRVKLFLKRRLSAETKTRLKRTIHRFAARFSSKSKPAAVTGARAAVGLKLQAHERVRVRSRAEIEAMLDTWGQFKGCSYMPGMWQYCGTPQRVLKPIERFLDERDYQVKKCRGIVLLEGLMCDSLPGYGRCDRSCHFFWREEWLERVDEAPPPQAPVERPV